jgi:DNA-binding HxlR family transcriptional regulator
MHTFKGKKYPCCTSLVMGIIGGKWKAVIIYNLTDKTLRYNELRKIMATVTERTLSLQLKKLENDGIIKRKVYTSKPPLRVEYSLTEFGKTLIPVINSMVSWGKYVIENKLDS